MQLSDALALVPNQVQQHGLEDVNAWNNCVPTSIMVCRALYGLPVSDPQSETDGVYGRGYIGGESFWEAEAWVEQNLGPAPGPVGGGMSLDELDAALRPGYAVIGFFNCDVNATITFGPGGFYHASLVLDHQPGDWHVLNVHDYSDHHYTESQMTAAMNGAGGFVYYASPIPIPSQQGDDDMTPDQDSLLRAIANKVLADPGYQFGTNPGDPSSTYYPGTANAWRWKWSDWYRDQHPELNLPAGPQSGAMPAGPGFSTQWGWADEIEEAEKAAAAAAAVAALDGKVAAVAADVAAAKSGIDELLRRKDSGNLA